MVIRRNGFTLIEMMIVLGILAVIASVAAPAVREMIAGQRVKTAAFDLYADLTFARSEAIKRNTNVTMQRSGGGWSTGWTVSVGATTLKSKTLGSSHLSVTGTGNSVTFNSAGRPASTVAITVSDPDGYATSRCISVDTSGRPATTRGACS